MVIVLAKHSLWKSIGTKNQWSLITKKTEPVKYTYITDINNSYLLPHVTTLEAAIYI